MLILGTYMVAFLYSSCRLSEKHCTVELHKQPGSPVGPVQLFLGQQALQATFLLFQNFERVQQTSSHLVTLKMLRAGQNVR